MSKSLKIIIIFVIVLSLTLGGLFLLGKYSNLSLPFFTKSELPENSLVFEDTATSSAQISPKLNNPPSGCIAGQSLTLDELTQASEVIIQGKVSKITPKQEGNGPIHTISEVSVSESLKGQAANIITIKTSGGTIGKITDHSPCQPKFTEGEEVIVFLQKDPQSNNFKVFPNYQGKFSSSLDEVKNYVKKITGTQSFFFSVKNLIAQFLSLFSPTALAWEKFTTPEGYGIKWVTADRPIRFLLHETPNIILGNVTYDAVRTAMSWWNNGGAGQLFADPLITSECRDTKKFFELGNECSEIAFTDTGTGRIVQGPGGIVNPMDIQIRTDCSTLFETSGQTFCKIVEVDIIMMAVSADLAAQQLGFALGLTDPAPNVSYIDRPMVVMNSKSLLYPGLNGLTQDDISGIQFIYPDPFDRSVLDTTPPGNSIDSPATITKSSSGASWPNVSLNANTSAGGKIYIKEGSNLTNGPCTGTLCQGWTQIGTASLGISTLNWNPNTLSINSGIYTFGLFDNNVSQILSTDSTTFSITSTPPAEVPPPTTTGSCQTPLVTVEIPQSQGADLKVNNFDPAIANSVYVSVTATCTAAPVYAIGISYWDESLGKWVLQNKTNWQKENFASFNLTAGIRQYEVWAYAAVGTNVSPATWSDFYAMSNTAEAASSAANSATLSWSLKMNFYNGVACLDTGCSQTPKFYLLLGTDPAILSNRAPTAGEIEIPSSFKDFDPANYSITAFQDNYAVDQLVSNATYYWRIRTDHPGKNIAGVEINNSYFSGGSFKTGSGTIATLPGNCSVALAPGGITYNDITASYNPTTITTNSNNLGGGISGPVVWFHKSGVCSLGNCPNGSDSATWEYLTDYTQDGFNSYTWNNINEFAPVGGGKRTIAVSEGGEPYKIACVVEANFPAPATPPPPTPPPTFLPTTCNPAHIRATELVTTPTIFGKFGTSSGACVTDEKTAFPIYFFENISYTYLKQEYYDKKSGPKQPLTSPSLSSITNDTSYYKEGDLAITGPITGNGSATAVVIVNGSLSINTNITDGTSNGSSAHGLVLVVKDNIYIDKSVTRIDAVLISSGTIYTATTNTQAPVTPCNENEVLITAPSGPLVVNGSLIALNSSAPIKFCRFLLDNRNPAEVINHRVKFVVILRKIFSESPQNWTEFSGPIPDLPTAPKLQPPPAPSGLSTQVISSSQINLSWGGSLGAVNYKVFSCQGSSCSPSSSQPEIVTAPTTSFSHTGLACNSTYRYMVRATNAAGDSADSNIAQGTTPLCPPPAPTGLSATAFGPTQINLVWDIAPTATSYKVFYCTGNGCQPNQQIPSCCTTTSYSHQSLTCNTLYRYAVIATNSVGDSPRSNLAQTTTAACFDYSLASSGNITVNPGQPGSNTVTVNLTSGSTQSVNLSASGLPAGASASFTNNPCNPTCSSTLNISTSTSTPTGNHTITVTGPATSSGNKSTSFTLAVNAPPLDFSLSASNVSITAGLAANHSISVNYISGTSQVVQLNVTGLPNGVTYTYNNNNPCSPSCTSLTNINASTSTTPGTYTITVTGTAGSIIKTTQFNLTVNPNCTNGYQDWDFDGYGAGDYTCHTPSSFQVVTNNSDCYDFNANAKPGQTAYFTTARGSVPDYAGNDGNSYDYNCDGASIKQPQYNCLANPNGCRTNFNSAHAGFNTTIPECGGSATWINVGRRTWSNTSAGICSQTPNSSTSSSCSQTISCTSGSNSGAYCLPFGSTTRSIACN